MRQILTILAAAGVALALPGVAAAQQAAPPDSELDQYVPSYPGAEGEKDLGGSGGGNGGDGGGGGGGNTGALPEGTAEELSAAGSSGEEAAAFAAGSAPDAGQGGNGGDGKSGGGGDGKKATPAANAVAGTLVGDSSDGGMGLLLPLLLVGITAAGVLYALIRRGVIRWPGGG